MESAAPIVGTIHTFDGQAIRVRPIESCDWQALQRFHSTLSEQTIEQRMFDCMPSLSDERAHYFCDVDGFERFALVALDPADPSEIIGVVRFDREPLAHMAEYAAVITDRWQGQGVGLALTVLLIEAALDRGIDILRAYVRSNNLQMLHLLRNLGLPETVTDQGGVECVDIEIAFRRHRHLNHPMG
jgi:acetyltransferase